MKSDSSVQLWKNLLYGSDGWTVTEAREARLDGCLYQTLDDGKNLNWRDHPTKETIYGDLPRASEVSGVVV